MFQRILFPTDGSDAAYSAFPHAMEIAANHGAELVILNVADTTRDSVSRIQTDVVDVLERAGEEIVRETAERAATRGISTLTEVLQGEPYRLIVDYSNDHDIDLIVIPTHGERGLSRLLLGSTTERVIRTAAVPVLALPPDVDQATEYPYERVLVPTDGSDGSVVAIERAIDIAATHDAELHTLYVVQTNLGADDSLVGVYDAFEEMGREAIELVIEHAEAAEVDTIEGAIGRGAPHRVILDYVEEHDIELIAMGTHGRTGLDRYLIGSVTEKVLRSSDVPVLTVRLPDQREAS